MPKFRKRPLEVEAVQWFPGRYAEGVLWDGARFYVETLEGKLFVSPGDWIITGTQGEKYPCKPDVFAQVYEACDAGAGS